MALPTGFVQTTRLMMSPIFLASTVFTLVILLRMEVIPTQATVQLQLFRKHPHQSRQLLLLMVKQPHLILILVSHEEFVQATSHSHVNSQSLPRKLHRARQLLTYQLCPHQTTLPALIYRPKNLQPRALSSAPEYRQPQTLLR